MPRRKLARRFEPRYGVTQEMLEAEAVWVGREFDDHLLLSSNDLLRMLREHQASIEQSELVIAERLAALPDRERTALRAMLARDFYHIATLYETFSASDHLKAAAGTSQVQVIRLEQKVAQDERLVVPFKEFLFES